jgi:hypothetical protein
LRIRCRPPPPSNERRRLRCRSRSVLGSGAPTGFKPATPRFRKQLSRCSPNRRGPVAACRDSLAPTLPPGGRATSWRLDTEGGAMGHWLSHPSSSHEATGRRTVLGSAGTGAGEGWPLPASGGPPPSAGGRRPARAVSHAGSTRRGLLLLTGSCALLLEPCPPVWVYAIPV